MDYEIVIPAAKKDYNKLKYVIESAQNFLVPQPKRINIIHAGHIGGAAGTSVKLIHEEEVLNLDPNIAKGFSRPPWIYQQFLKLFQDITEERMYLVIDSDLILNRKLELFNKESVPYFFLGVDQNHPPYFKYSDEMFGFGRVYNHSFISEIMMFDKVIIEALLMRFYFHQTGKYGNIIQVHQHEQVRNQLIKVIYEKTCDKACDGWIPADYEIYGNFVEVFNSSLYEKQKIKTNLRGKYSEWTDTDLESYISEMKDKDYDTFTAHTWL